MRGNRNKSLSQMGLLPKGKVTISGLGMEYAIKLDRLARKWGCETLGEAALELIRDGVDAELERRDSAKK